MIVFLTIALILLAVGFAVLSFRQNKDFYKFEQQVAQLKSDHMTNFYSLTRVKDDILSTKYKIENLNGLVKSKEVAISDLEGKVKSNGEILVLLGKEVDHLHHAVRILCFSHTYELAMVQRAESGEYPEEFKSDCAKFVIEEGKSLRESARLLNIPKSTLADWIEKYKKTKERK